MKTKISLIIPILAILLCFSLPCQGQPITIIESGDSYLVLELKSTSFNLVRHAGVLEAIQIADYNHGFITLKNGLKLPEVEMILDIPAGTRPKLRMVDYSSQSFSLGLLNPLDSNGEIQQDNRGQKKLLAKLKHRLLPFSLVEIEPLDEAKAKIRFYPVLFDPENKTLEFYKDIKVKVSFKKLKEKKIRAKRLSQQAGHYRISIDNDGVYVVTKEDLLACGVDPHQIKPNRFALFNKGKKIAINIKRDRSGNFTHLEFFGQANDSKYSLENIYWLEIKSKFGNNLVMDERNISPQGGMILDFYMEKKHFEENFLYQRSILEGSDVDHWFWKFLIAPNTINVDFQLQGIADVGELARLEVKLQGYSYTTTDPDHHILVYLNDNLLEEAWWDNAAQYIFETTFPLSYLVDGQNVLRLEAPGDTGASVDTVYLDCFTITYPRCFIAQDDILRFELKDYGKRRVEASGFSQPKMELFDIFKPEQPVILLNAAISSDGDGGYKVTFTDKIKGEATYLILTNDKKIAIDALIEDDPSSLCSRTNRADYVIITPADFKEAVLPLVDWRQQKGLIVKVIDVQDIYDEFNFGIFDPEAIKKFLQYAYNNWRLPPRYILLVGDASYDYKDYLGLGSRNFVPTVDVETEKMLAPSDNWFVCVEGEDNLPEMSIGRLAVSNPEELSAIINKIIDYESGMGPSGWNRNIMLVADNDEASFETMQDKLVENYIWPVFNVKKIYLSKYTTADSCHQAVIDGINSGALLLNYVGHGAEPLWANELILTSSDIDLFNNYQMYPLVLAMTCLNTYFHYPYSWFNTISESFVKAQDKGVIGFWSPSGLTSPSEQKVLADGFYAAVFLNNTRILGDATRQAEAYLYENAPTAVDLLKTIILLGDPALELNF